MSCPLISMANLEEVKKRVTMDVGPALVHVVVRDATTFIRNLDADVVVTDGHNHLDSRQVLTSLVASWAMDLYRCHHFSSVFVSKRLDAAGM